MKRLFFPLLLLFALPVQAVSIFLTDNDADVFNITSLLANGEPDPLFAAIAAGEDPNTATRIPLNFDAFTGQVFDISVDQITLTEVAPELGGGFALATVLGLVTIASPEFEIAYFDAFTDANNTPDWHTATEWEMIGEDTITLVFNPHPNEGASQAGLIVNDVGTFALPPQGIVINTIPTDVAAVPIGATSWLFGSGLLGLAGVARRRNPKSQKINIPCPS